jgi:hypothetical protein
MLPRRRDLHFPLDHRRILDWHPAGRQVSHFLNSMSVLFPVGERFFIHSVRHFRGHIGDPELQEAVKAFIGQEAMHGREHEAYNRALQAAGIPAEAMEAQVHALLEWFKNNTPPGMQLSGTVALEHFTATLANRLLADEAVLGEPLDPAMAALWRWHALEETEHKAVAFDVFRSVYGHGPRAEALRMAGLVIATPILFAQLGRMYLRTLRNDAVTRPLGSLRGWRRLAGYLLGNDPGVFRHALREYLDYFRPGFHPWDHDNRAFLEQVDTLVARVEALPEAA